MLAKMMFKGATFVGLLAVWSLAAACGQLSASPLEPLEQMGDDCDDHQQDLNRTAKLATATAPASQQQGGSRRPDLPGSSSRGLQANSELWLMRTLADIMNMGPNGEGGAGGGSDFKKPIGREALEKMLSKLASRSQLLALVAPALTGGKLNNSYASSSSTTTTTTTTTTSTTTLPPAADTMRQINRSLGDLGSALTSSGARMLGAPIKMLNGILYRGANLTRAGALGLGDSLMKDTSEMVSQVASEPDEPKRNGRPSRQDGLRLQNVFDDDWKFYEYAGPYEPYAFRRPKYFSRECPFRFACEVGKLVKPVTGSFSKSVETNRFIQDLQNRYTRAMTYGSSRGDCSRYYCVLVKMLGGPVGFAGGVAEIVNRALNSDLYGDYASSQKVGYN